MASRKSASSKKKAPVSGAERDALALKLKGEGKSSAEIGRRLGVSSARARQILARAEKAALPAEPPVSALPPPVRPVVASGEIDWAEVDRLAGAGTPRDEIMLALDITDAQLGDRETAERFTSTIVRAHAKYRAGLRVQIKERGEKTGKEAGSVNALSLQARNHLDWDRDMAQRTQPPDLASARDRLRDTLGRLAARRSEIEGRTITPEMLIFREAMGAGAEVHGA